MTSSGRGFETRDLRKLKAAANALPPDSFVRTLLQGEPDFISDDQFVARADVWVRAIFAEREAARVAVLVGRPLPVIERAIRQVPKVA